MVVQDTWKGEARLHINVPAKGEHDAPPLPYFLKGKAEYNQVRAITAVGNRWCAFSC